MILNLRSGEPPPRRSLDNYGRPGGRCMDQDQSHSMRSLSILGFILLGAAAGAGVTASTASPSTSLKLNILDGRPSVSNVFLNGRGPYRFLLDTGAQSNQIDTAVAEELAVTATFRTDFVTAA